jgi:hypothetical protein
VVALTADANVLAKLARVLTAGQLAADVERAGFLGPFDDAERLVADLLIAHAKKVRPGCCRACRPDMSSKELHRVSVLLERGAQADALDEDGLTPLLYLSKTRSKSDRVPVMELLAASGARIDA